METTILKSPKALKLDQIDGHLGQNGDAPVRESTGPGGDSEKKKDTAKGKTWIMGLTKREIWLILVMGIVDFSSQTFQSLMGPFYAVNARSKGVSGTAIGMVFGVFPLVSLFISPVFGAYLSYFGVKFMLVTGMTSAGYCCFLFGFLDWIEDPNIYILLGLLIRAVEGVACSAAWTASYGTLAHTFPHRLGAVSAYFEAMAGLGFLTGSPIGGLLYYAGGFVVPFTFFGVLMIVIGLLPCLGGSLPQCENVHYTSHWPLLRRPNVVLALVNLVGGLVTISFFIASVGVFMYEKYSLQLQDISFSYILMAATYLLGTFIWGTLAEKNPAAGPFLFSGGFIIAAVCYMFLGSTTLFEIPSPLWMFLTLLSLGLMGLSSALVAFQTVGLETARMYGTSLNTAAWVAGILQAFYCLGEFLGPVITGYAKDCFGFTWTLFIVGCMLLSLATTQLLYHLTILCCQRYKGPDDESVPFADTAGLEKTLYSQSTIQETR